MSTAFDFDSNKARLVSSLQSKELWKKFLSISTNTSIIDPYAEEEARFAAFVEYLTRENKWDTFQNITSGTSQATINGYIPKRKVGAIGFLKVGASENFDTPPANNVPIPKNTRFSNGTYTYSALESYTLTTADNYIEVAVVQGEPSSLTFTAIGINFEEFIITNDSIENTYYNTYVNSILWTNVDDIRESDTTDEEYQIVNEFDFSGIRLRFGNNLNGKKLELSDSIRFEYYITDGSLGNILTSDNITTVSDTLSDITGNVVEIFVTNDDTVTGGADIESVTEIRAKAPQIGQAFNAATTNTSYKALIEDIPFVSKAVVWGAIEYNLDLGLPYSTFIPAEENRIRISAFTDSGDQLSEAQQDFIIASLLDRKAPTDIPLFVDVDFLKLRFKTSAYSSTRDQALSAFKSNIEDFLDSEYSLFNFDFKQPLYESDYKSAIDNPDNITGMGNHSTIISIILEETFNSAYVADFTLQIDPIFPTSVEVWVKDTTTSTNPFILIGIDNGSGGFTAEAGYDLTGSVVNYANGAGTLVVASGLSGTFSDYDIQFYFEQNNTDPNTGERTKDLIPTGRNQIFEIEEKEVFVDYQG